ncbi:MAG: AAA family ATPase [Acidimicrobiia bacterium]|nr:AAA family ATPase [Acidimicrobiia bacterium]
MSESSVFVDVIGHAGVIDLLEDDVSKPAHAYLFVGPASAGKATVARRFAAALIGDDPAVQQRVLAGNHPDVMIVEPEGRASITVDQARQAVSQASLSPLEAQRKIFLFEEAGIMNDEAANALLKTLEEPSRSTIFILVAESEDDLPDTVASRSRTVVLGRVMDDEIEAGLVAIGVEPERAASVTSIAGGRPGLAIALATQPAVAEFRQMWLSIPPRLSEHPGEAYLLADEVQAAAEPLLATLKERQQTEVSQFDREGRGGKALKERHDRELRRATSAIYETGLEILAGFYRDSAAAQVGANVRNSDIPATDLAKVLPAHAIAAASRVLETVEALQAHQRPQLAFAALFSELGAST